MNSTIPNKRRAFTLIELLTVIAIIGVLAAILIPAIGGVRAKANAAISSSNKREIYGAFMSYVADNKGKIPRAYDGLEWNYKVGKYLGYTHEQLIATGERPVGVFADPNSEALTSSDGRADYGYNRYMADPPGAGSGDDPSPFTQFSVQGGAETVLLVDMIRCSRVAWPTWGIDARHPSEQVQVLWWDGHVSSEDTLPDGSLGSGGTKYRFEDDALHTPVHNKPPWGWPSRPYGS